MKISSYLKSLKQEKLKTDLFSALFLFVIIIISTSLCLILLESVFYFSPETKKIIIRIIFIMSTITVFFIGGFLFLVKHNYFKSYTSVTLAKIIGKNIFPKNADTALNAFQIETSKNKSQSNELANNFTREVAKKMQNHIPSNLIDKKPLLNIKMITFVIMFLSILALSLIHI